MTVGLLTRRLVTPLGRLDDRGPRARRIRLWAGVAIALWVVTATAHVVLAYAHGKAGKGELERARQMFGRSGPSEEEVTAALERAGRSFERARQRSSSPLLLPLEVLPVLGRQLRSYSALAGAGGRVAEIASAGAEDVRRVLDRPTSAGEARVSMLRTLAEVARRADTELARVPVHRRDGLIPPLARQWTELDEHLGDASEQFREGAQVLDAVAATLSGPRRYLLLVANNAEMRAGSGMFLGIGTIEATGGALRLGPIRAAGEMTLPEPGVEPEGDVKDRWGWLQPGREWRNLATTPRFDATAALAAQMWERHSGQTVDGVVSVDAEFLRGILAATGPLVVGSDTLTEANVVKYVLHDQYRGMTIDATQDTRRDRLGDIAASALGAVEEGRVSLRTLGQEAAGAGRGRHLLVWSRHPAEQQAWDAAGVSGSLGPTSLAVSVLNRGGNKLDQFLTVDAAIDLRSFGGTTDVTLRVGAANRTPPDEPSYVAGPHPQSGVGAGDYLGLVSVNLPAAATDVTVDDTPRLAAAGRDGPTYVVAAPLLVRPGDHKTVSVRFRLPGEDGVLAVHPSARLPPVRWQAGAERWVDDSTRHLRW